MNVSNENQQEMDFSDRDLRAASRRVPATLRQFIETHTKEEVAEWLTTYTPGVPHYWFGRPVAPLTKEELLLHWNGGPEPEIRYLDGKDASGKPIPTDK